VSERIIAMPTRQITNAPRTPIRTTTQMGTQPG
jgi:hypothetical protein